MKIAYLTTRFPSLSETFVYREIEALRSLGVEIRTYSSQLPHPDHVFDGTKKYVVETCYLFPPRLQNLAVSCVYWLFKKPATFIGTLATLLIHPNVRFGQRLHSALNFFEGVCLASYLVEDCVDHIHVHLSTGAVVVGHVAGRLSGLATSFTAHGTALLVKPTLIDYKVKNACFVVAISQFNKNFMIANVSDSADKVHVIHCGVDTAIFSPESQERNLGNGTIRFLNVGRLVWQKAQHKIIEALAKLRELGVPGVLTIIGDGPERVRLTELINKLQLEKAVTLTGALNPDSISKAYKTSDIFVLSSISEGIPIALMEAMSCELPVIATKITGIPELVDHMVNGILVDPHNSELLFEAMLKLSGDQNLRKGLGREARVKVKKEFDLMENSRQLCKLFSEQAETRK